MAAASTSQELPAFVVKDKTILAFYADNPNLDFVTMNHILIDILKKLSVNLNETVMGHLQAKMMGAISDMARDVASLKQDVQKVETNVVLKLHDMKKEFTDGVQLILTNHSLSASEKTTALMEKCRADVVSHTKMLLTETMPANRDQICRQVDVRVQQLQTTLMAEVQKMGGAQQTREEWTQALDKQFCALTQSLPQMVQAVVQTGESRVQQSLDSVKEKLAVQNTAQEVLGQEINAFLNRYKHNSSSKGILSEGELYMVLQQLFPSDEVVDTRSETAACDYRVNRLNKSRPTLLFENKDYERPVSTEEVRKFERDVQLQKQHGIFLSQKSGIAFKENFQIDISDGLVRVYVTNVQYAPEKIQVAVDLVDHLAGHLAAFAEAAAAAEGGGGGGSAEATINLSKEDLNELLEEYNTYVKQRLILVEHVKQTTKVTLERLEEMSLPCVKRMLTKYGLLKTEDEFRCKFCGVYNGKNKASLSAHVRVCKANPNAVRVGVAATAAQGQGQAETQTAIIAAAAAV